MEVKAPAVPSAIRDQRLRKLYEYWLTRKGARRYPSRRDIA